MTHGNRDLEWYADRLAEERRESERLRLALRETEMAAPFYEEHRNLTEKIFTGGLSVEGQKRLEFVRDQLDALETRRASQWTRMTELITFHQECFRKILDVLKLEHEDRDVTRYHVDLAREVSGYALKERP